MAKVKKNTKSKGRRVSSRAADSVKSRVGSARASRSKPSTGQDSSDSLAESIRREIWPAERAVLFRPERLRYVRKMIKPDGCVFCNALAKGPSAESLLLHANEYAMIILNKYPYNPGHLLVLPRRHCGDFLALSEIEMHEINDLIRRAVAAITESSQPAGFNVGLNLGSAAGAGIPEHLHYHVVPRWSGDTNFFPLLAETKVVVETLEETYRRLLPYFEGAK